MKTKDLLCKTQIIFYTDTLGTSTIFFSEAALLQYSQLYLEGFAMNIVYQLQYILFCCVHHSKNST